RLYNLKGYIHRLGGQIPLALKCHRQAQNIEAGGLPQLQLSSWLHIGLCQRDLWELDKAQYAFERVLDLSQESNSQQYVVYARCCLAYIHSHQGDRDRAKTYLQQIDQIRLRQQVTTWGSGYSLLFLAHTYRRLGAWDGALELFYETLGHAQTHQFAQIRGKALNGLAQIHRNLGDLNQALTHHDEALATLEPLGAHCIVAEALTQRAVTYRALGCHDASQVDLDLATQQFQAIPPQPPPLDAPTIPLTPSFFFLLSSFLNPRQSPPTSSNTKAKPPASHGQWPETATNPKSHSSDRSPPAPAADQIRAANF
ncbi:MAG: tetratricopeptide repeat protein, partial [Alkalinema sp. RU_4_3]|nr:tetratricopeptide repeat protein [Alkalinema sp. RU_4_3]